MLHIETDYGTFADFKSLLYFMRDEKIKELKATTFYNFSKHSTLTLTKEDIEQILNREEK